MNKYLVGRYSYSDGTNGIKVVRIGRNRTDALDSLPPTMFEVVEIAAATSSGAKLEFAARFFGVS